MDLLDIHNAVKRDLGKERAGYFSPEEIDEALDRAQMQEFWFLIGDERQYQPGRALPPVSYGLSRKLHNALAPFKVDWDVVDEDYDSTTQPNGTSQGVIVLPSNFEYLTAISGGASIRFKIINEDELEYVQDSEIVAPSAAHRYLVHGTGGDVNGIDIGAQQKLTSYPTTGFDATVFYLRRPATPAMSYTLSGRSFTYDAGASTQMEWRDGEVNRVIQRAVSILAKNLQEDGPYAREAQENRM